MIYSRTETPLESVEKFELGFPVPKYEKRVGQVWELRNFKSVPLQKAAEYVILL